MKIVILDGYTVNPGDLSWEPFQLLGDVAIYDRTPPALLAERAHDADAVIVNKIQFDAASFKQLPQLSYIGVSATGVNNIDLEAASRNGVTVTNVKGYSSAAVAQHTFALLLALTNHVELHSQSVQAGDWVRSADWSYRQTPLVELQGKTLGLIGLGDIGSAVAQIAVAFGMRVLAYRKHSSRSSPPGVEQVPLETLFRESDVVSLHCPLTAETNEMINKDSLSRMKPSACLINTGRGALIREADLAEALHAGTIAGAGLDVLSSEPPAAGNPLLKAPNCIITPHIAWAAFEARKRLLLSAAENLKAFQEGKAVNVMNP